MTEKKDISLQVDKGIEGSQEASQILFIDENFIKNANFYMKYLDQLKTIQGDKN